MNPRSQQTAASIRRPRIAVRATLAGAVLAATLAAGCAVEVQNTQAARALEQQRRPAGSVYAGWRVFQDKCATCHGAAATGGSGGPDLLPRVREMGAHRFVGVVLQRYDWHLPPAQAATDGAAREALVEQIVARRSGELTMPAWQGEPRVSAHIADLYAYLSARAQGTLGPQRPVH
ncbi:MAG: c-type cytochrome [Aquabacterium sp.]|jgi:mono/diheme cytochrome c family protein|nr:c-type cytochrome [Aquabacterium sp.]